MKTISALMMTFLAVGVLACTGDKGTSAEKAVTGSAEHGSAGSAGSAGSVGDAATGSEAVVDPAIADCISKVRNGDYQAAVPVCMQAAKIDPNNEQLQAATAKVAAYQADLASAAAQAQGAVDNAQKQAADAQKQAGDAQKQLNDAAKGFAPPKMP